MACFEGLADSLLSLSLGPSGDKAAAISRKQSAITGSSLKQSYLLYRRALGYCVIVSA